jgi:hypothetical protein
LFPDGIKILKEFNAAKYNICILDIIMPKMEGNFTIGSYLFDPLRQIFSIGWQWCIKYTTK